MALPSRKLLRMGGRLARRAGPGLGRLASSALRARPRGFRRGGRGRGITSRELRGFNKVVGLLKRVGMVPRRLGGHARIKSHRRW